MPPLGLLSPLRRAAKSLLRKAGYEVHRLPSHDPATPYETIRPRATYAPWRRDEAFLQIYRKVRDRTLVDVYRLWELWTLVEQAAKVGGALLEVGVWRGGSGALIAHRAEQCGFDSPVFLCDTFRGVVKAADQDADYRGGEHADTSLEQVRRFLDDLGLTRTVLLQGVFPDETGDRVADRRFALCHIDVDTYQSAADIVEWVWPRLNVGGMVVYDDYGFAVCSGIARHVEEQRSRPGCLVLHNLNGHAVLIKTAETAQSNRMPPDVSFDPRLVAA
ncbi:TylF/MycF/NovP-related O-methyltransferase [Thermopirellula anaerolimosa]